MTPTTEFIEPESTGLLDGVIGLVENIKVLISAPIVGGLIGLAIAFALPQSYTSSAIISTPIPIPPNLPITTPQQVASIMGSPVVLDPVIDALGLSPGLSRDIARTRLGEQVKTSVGKDNLVRLEVTADTPARAQKIASAVISAWLKSTRPSDRERADLEKKLEYTKASLSTVDKVFLHLLNDSPQESLTVSRKDAGISLVAVAELRDHYLEQVLLLPRTLEGISPDVVKQVPTLPTAAAKPKKSLVVLLCAAIGLLLAVFWVLMQSWVSKAKASPVTAEKLARLGSRLKLGNLARKT
jgi:uncharacterized protein involved in exopolysaccharide biosynthesis